LGIFALGAVITFWLTNLIYYFNEPKQEREDCGEVANIILAIALIHILATATIGALILNSMAGNDGDKRYKYLQFIPYFAALSAAFAGIDKLASHPKKCEGTKIYYMCIADVVIVLLVEFLPMFYFAPTWLAAWVADAFGKQGKRKKHLGKPGATQFDSHGNPITTNTQHAVATTAPATATPATAAPVQAQPQAQPTAVAQPTSVVQPAQIQPQVFGHQPAQAQIVLGPNGQQMVVLAQPMMQPAVVQASAPSGPSANPQYAPDDVQVKVDAVDLGRKFLLHFPGSGSVGDLRKEACTRLGAPLERCGITTADGYDIDLRSPVKILAKNGEVSVRITGGR
jgi:hypothetical protein